MNPLILQYAEVPNAPDTDENELEYSNELNLTVLKGSKVPAIEHLSFDTQTMTKAGNEPSDSDDNQSGVRHASVDTETRTYTKSEVADSDSDIRNLIALINTQTFTEAKEATDSDR